MCESYTGKCLTIDVLRARQALYELKLDLKPLVVTAAYSLLSRAASSYRWHYSRQNVDAQLYSQTAYGQIARFLFLHAWEAVLPDHERTHEFICNLVLLAIVTSRQFLYGR